jgi:cell cycle sensor histidine kinase DivJ
MSKIETGNFAITPEPFAPAQAVASCCDLLVLRASEAGVRLERLAGAELPDIVADKRAVQQILLNLVSNAIRFTDRGGTVTVSARAEAATITFAVDDDGVGIGEADLARVGEPYFQAAASHDRRHAGTGLGLSIVKGLVRLHGGDLSIDSRIGQGTRVTVRLPLDCERAQPGKKSAVDQPAGVVSYLAAAAHDASSDHAGDAVPQPQRQESRQEIRPEIHRDIRVRKSA